MKIDKVLLAGATGYLGKYITHELLEKEYKVKLVVRNLNKIYFDPKKFELIQAEITRPETLEGIARMAFQVLEMQPKFKYIPDGIRKFILWLTITFTSSKTYGPIEFSMTVLGM